MATTRKNKSHDNTCRRCGKIVEYMTRLEQDDHEKECIKQQKLL
jgi:ribosomal protein L37E